VVGEAPLAAIEPQSADTAAFTAPRIGVTVPRLRTPALRSAIARAALEQLRSNDFARLVQDSPTPERGEPRPPSDGLVTQTTAPEDLYVLGFICKKLPRCPDPDPAFTW
jgi:hypothetical protein